MAMLADDQSVLEDLRAQTLDALKAAIDVSRPVALLDLPVHTNVGDHMILAGEIAYLERLGVRIGYVCDVRRFDASILRSRMPEGTVLVHGGGNFGDIWLEHQSFRELVARELVDYPIVQLPQTVYFSDLQNAIRANEILGSHPRYTLMVRDRASVDRVERQLPDLKATFVPDMALGWSPERIPVDSPKGKHTIVLARTDKESAESLTSMVTPLLAGEDRIIDWHMAPWTRTKYTVGRIPGKLSNGGNDSMKRRLLYPLIRKGYGMINRSNLDAGMQLLSGADVVVTDRLHAHILATLMGIPNIAMDNSYGKVRALYDDYLSRFSTTGFASDEQELQEIYWGLKESSGFGVGKS